MSSHPEVRLEGHELAALYERYAYLVHRRCLALLGSRSDADDALQETFLRVRRYPPASLPDSPLAWLYTIAQNCCFDLLKRRGREVPSGEEAPLPEPSVGSGQDADRRAVLGAAIRKLDAATREIGLLHHLGGLTQEEVAEATRLSRKTVGKKLHLFEVLVGNYFSLGER